MRISLDKYSYLHDVNSVVTRAMAIHGLFKTAKQEPNPRSPKVIVWTIEDSEPLPEVKKKKNHFMKKVTTA